MAVVINGTTGITTPGLDADNQSLVVDHSTNRVGIGTASPSNELDVYGTGTVALFAATGGNAWIGIRDHDDGTMGFIGVDGGTLRFQTPGSSYADKLTINSDGNVGVGFNNATQKLSVNGTIGITGSTGGYTSITDGTYLRFGTLNSTGSTFLGYGVRAKTNTEGGTVNQLVSTTDINLGRSAIIVGSLQGGASGTFQVWTGPGESGVADGGSLSNFKQRLTITDAGLVGIGTDVPGDELDIRSDGATYVNIQRTTAGSEGKIQIGANNGYNNITSRDGTTGDMPLTVNIGTTETLRVTSEGLTGRLAPSTLTITKGASLYGEVETFTLGQSQSRIVLNHVSTTSSGTRTYTANINSGVPTTLGSILHVQFYSYRNNSSLNTGSQGLQGHQTTLQLNGTTIIDTEYQLVNYLSGINVYTKEVTMSFILTSNGWKEYVSTTNQIASVDGGFIVNSKDSNIGIVHYGGNVTKRGFMSGYNVGTTASGLTNNANQASNTGWISWGKGDNSSFDTYKGRSEMVIYGNGTDAAMPVYFTFFNQSGNADLGYGNFAGSLTISFSGSQNPSTFNNTYNNWAGGYTKLRYDLPHWNAKPTLFAIEHHVVYNRPHIFDIDYSTTHPVFWMYMLPGIWIMEFESTGGLTAHWRNDSNVGGAVDCQGVGTGSAIGTLSPLAYSSRDTRYDSTIMWGANLDV